MKAYLVKIPVSLSQEWDKYSIFLKRDACLESIMDSPQAMGSMSVKPLKQGKYENISINVRLQASDAKLEDIRHAFRVLVARCQNGDLFQLIS
jgi:hypothetical protein